MQKLANVHFANREDCSNQKDHFKDFACDLLWNKRQHEKKNNCFVAANIYVLKIIDKKKEWVCASLFSF